MFKRLITFIRQRVVAGKIPEGKWGLRILGHRRYVGGMWDVIGKFQFDYMLALRQKRQKNV